MTDPTVVARCLDRVAALVGAGLSPDRAWRLVAGSSTDLASLDAALEGAPGAAPDGSPPRIAVPVVDALSALGGPWASVGVVLGVAARTGAPVAPALAGFATAMRDAAAGARAVEVALAGPRSSARIVLALPVVGLLLASMWGADPLRVLATTPPGWGCSATAALLVLAARRWSARMIRAATRDPGAPVAGLSLDVAAVALTGGGSWTAARLVVDDALGSVVVPDVERRLGEETVALAVGAGVPAAALLRAAAEDVRRDVAARELVAAERLAVRLVLPLGVCVLPAFVLVGVVPVVAGLLSSTVGVLA